jgi:hypothetical protein
MKVLEAIVRNIGVRCDQHFQLSQSCQMRQAIVATFLESRAIARVRGMFLITAYRTTSQRMDHLSRVSQWRGDEKLNLNFLWPLCYITKAPRGHISRIRFDNIVVAKEYIGPIAPNVP